MTITDPPESCLQRQLLVLSQAWEQVASACEAEMEASKTALLLSGVCDSSSVYQVPSSLLRAVESIPCTYTGTDCRLPAPHRGVGGGRPH